MIALAKLIGEHPDAVAYDLLRCGARLRDFPNGGVTWHDLAVLVRAAQPGSAIYATRPRHLHTNELELLRQIEVGIRTMTWSWSAKKGTPPPEPMVFPWEDDDRNGWRGDALEWDEAVDALGGDERLRNLMAVA